MRLLQLWKTDNRIYFTLTADGAVQCKSQLHSPPSDWDADRIGLPPLTLHSILDLLNGYAAWEIRDGQAIARD